MPHATAEAIADPSQGSCRRMRNVCMELGPWRPFYKGYVCDACLAADQEDVAAHRNPPGDMGQGKLFRKASDD